MEFLMRHPEIHWHVVIFSVGNTIGQIFIFQTIRSFGAVIFAILMNTRVLLSILFSCIIYSHSISSQGFFGLFIVFASVPNTLWLFFFYLLFFSFLSGVGLDSSFLGRLPHQAQDGGSAPEMARAASAGARMVPRSPWKHGHVTHFCCGWALLSRVNEGVCPFSLFHPFRFSVWA